MRCTSSQTLTNLYVNDAKIKLRVRRFVMYINFKKIRSLREDVSSFASFVWELDETCTVTVTE